MLIKMAVCNFLLKYMRSPAPAPAPAPETPRLAGRFKSSYSAASVFQAMALTAEVCLSFWCASFMTWVFTLKLLSVCTSHLQSLPTEGLVHFCQPSLCTVYLPDTCSQVLESVVSSVMSDSATPRTVAHQTRLSMGFSRQEYWSGLPFPSPGAFLTQGLNQALLYCRQILNHSTREIPTIRC